jgi:mannosylglycerate hydrolase
MAHDTSARTVWVVPHTHWDREWYSAAQTFRLRLVDLLDDLLPDLERNPAYAHFMLDGQVAVIDDYLEVRPAEADRIRRLAANGRLGVGPWYVLMDEFLVSGETIVRDLQMGLDRAASFGGAMEVGYLPDMFGHVAQMPQLLRGFGFEHAAVWRGVPSAVDRSAFWWESPDGSVVRAEYMPDGYGNGSGTPDDAKELVARVQAFVDTWDGLLTGPILWMNGTDHEVPQPWLGRVVAEANALQDNYRLVVGSLADYLAAAPTENLPRWRGELRSGARANLLMGVASNRVDVKQAAAAAERWIERLAEPAAALWQPGERWPGALFDVAWRNIVLNSAHDSSCACSIDEVCDAVNVRYAEARQLGEGLTDRAVQSLGAQVGTFGVLVANTTARTRSGIVGTTLAGHEPVPGTQQLRQRGGRRVADPVTLPSAAELTRMMLAWERHLTHVEITEVDGMVHICPLAGTDRAQPGALVLEVDDAVEHLRQRAEALTGADRTALMACMVADVPEHQKVLAYVDRVPGFGWTVLEPGSLPAHLVDASVLADGSMRLANGLAEVVVDAATGTFSLNGTTGLGRLVDDGDVGDTYNWCPPHTDRVIDAPHDVRLELVESGPLRATVRVERTYRWPVAGTVAARSTADADVVVTTTVQLAAGSSLVSVELAFDNPSEDHRLRAWLPLPARAGSSEAECAFATVRRPLLAEGGPTEAAMATYPMRRFVCAGGLTVITDGLLEYELVDLDGDPTVAGTTAGAVAVTLLRCTGLISRGPMSTRPLPAGPLTPTPGAQMPGCQRVRFALAAGDDPQTAYALADEALIPWQVGVATGAGTLPATGASLEVLGAEVSSLRRRDGALEIRVFNPSDAPTVVEVPARSGWQVDLRGRTIAPFEGRLELRAWGIATVRLND